MLAAIEDLSLDSVAPCERSAACFTGLGSDSGEALLLGGDTGSAGSRLADIWLLRTAGAEPCWLRLNVSNAAGAMQPRSNAAIAVAGDTAIIYGGWHMHGTRPLAELAVLDLKRRVWVDTPASSGNDSLHGSQQNGNGVSASSQPATDTAMSTVQGVHPAAAAATTAGPSPRGQPAMAGRTDGSAVFLFGGWNGERRFNDLWRLDCCSWQWTLMSPSGKPPPARADHTAVMLHYCDCGHWKDILAVFGGSSADGLLDDVWLYDVDTDSWKQAHCGGTAPAARSSHAAMIVGGCMLISGGQACGVVFDDLHVLDLTTLTWQQQLAPQPPLPPRCRHGLAVTCDTPAMDQPSALELESLKASTGHAPSTAPKAVATSAADGDGRDSSTVAGSVESATAADAAGNGRIGNGMVGSQPPPQQQHTAWLFGGFDGEETRGELFGIPLPLGFGSSGAAGTRNGADAEGLSAQETPEQADLRKTPFSAADMDDPAAFEALPSWKKVRRLHAAAVEKGRDTYIDPATGYTVFTAHYLGRRPCCGNACRHCPHGHVNVVRS